MSAVPSVALNPSPVRRKRRHWYLAALLSVMWPGLGQLYNGQLSRALSFAGVVVGIFAIAIILSHWIGASFAVIGAVIGLVALAMLVYVASAIDAGRYAWRVREIELRRYNRVWVYLLYALSFFSLNVSGPLTGWASYSIPAGSMIPVAQVGDVLAAERGYFLRHAPERGELAIFKLPTYPRVDYIKRVIGLPGDTIQMIGGRLHINGGAVERERIEDAMETYGAATIRIRQYVETLPGGRRYRIREERGDEAMLDNTPVYEVPVGHYFVLGDNRDNSQDSRVLAEVGFIPRANFRDRPAYIYWSRDRARIGLHLE